MKPSHLFTLYKLAELGAHEKQVLCSTEEIAKSVEASQQTASRRLIEMEKEGLIERTKQGRHQLIRITELGAQQLTGMYQVLKKSFEGSPKRDLIFEGVVFTGLKEGSYYVNQEGYRKQFRSKLGFDPFPGTLNVRVRKEDIPHRKALDSFPSVHIEGFQDEKRSFGAAKCYRAVVDDKVECAIIVPIRAHYGEDVIELIAPHSLRKQLHLKDGDMVKIRATIEDD